MIKFRSVYDVMWFVWRCEDVTWYRLSTFGVRFRKCQVGWGVEKRLKRNYVFHSCLLTRDFNETQFNTNQSSFSQKMFKINCTLDFESHSNIGKISLYWYRVDSNRTETCIFEMWKIRLESCWCHQDFGDNLSMMTHHT